MDWWIFAIVGYVCGSVPFGLLLSKAAGLGDVRNIGSGSIGATNVLRTGNKKAAALTLLFDMLKGLLPVLAAKYYGGPLADVAAGFGAMAGHIFPVWLNFTGGKGVATGLGVMSGWYLYIAFPALCVWIGVFYATRYSSLASLSAAIAAVLFTFFIEVINKGNNISVVWPVLAMAILVFITHRANIGRLRRGEEPKSSFSKKP